MELKVKELLECYQSLKDEYSTLEETQMNLFNNLSNIYGMDWKDGNSIAFGRVIDTDRTEADSFRNYIEGKIDAYKFIYDLYSTIGNKVRWVLENRDNVLSSITNDISHVSGINRQFSQINLSFGYGEFVTLRNMKNYFERVKGQLEDIHSYYVEMFNKIDGFEKEIGAKIKELDAFKVAPYEYTLTYGNQEAIGFANLEEGPFDVDVQKFELYKTEENSSHNRLYNGLNRITSLYRSDNIGAIQAGNRDYHTNISDSLTKREGYLNTLRQVPVLYAKQIKDTKDAFENQVFEKGVE